MLAPATFKALQDELANPMLDEYSAVVLARQAFARGDEHEAMSRLRKDSDKFYCVAPLLCSIVKNWHEEQEAAAAQWTHPPRDVSPREKFWTKWLK
jgi:hypothetical protein